MTCARAYDATRRGNRRGGRGPRRVDVGLFPRGHIILIWSVGAAVRRGRQTLCCAELTGIVGARSLGQTGRGEAEIEWEKKLKQSEEVVVVVDDDNNA